MNDQRIKSKLSQIVASQLPEVIRNDYPTFVSFIEAYYKFLEQDQNAQEVLQNAMSYNDIDSTIDQFVKYFVRTYVPSLPDSSLVDKRFFIKKVKDLYEAKGSELSFKLLFSILFQTNVTITYPFENVLRASDGKWQQQFSIKVETVSGDRNLLTNRLLTYVYSGVTYRVPILNVVNLNDSISEFFLDPKSLPPDFNAEDSVTVFSSQGVIFEGIIKKTITSYTILRRGSAFKLGQIFNVNLGGGVGSIAKISNVNSTGGIEKLKLINYGYNYPFENGNIVVQLNKDSTVSELYDDFITADNMQGFTESGALLSYNTLSESRFFDTDYISDSSTIYTFSDVIRSFGDSSFISIPISSEIDIDPSIASVAFTEGVLGKYPGSYYKNDSFISESDVRIQDEELYQPFAYLTNTDVDIERFFEIVKDLIHPAGQKLVNNRLLSTDIDFSNVTYLTPSSNNIGFEALSVFEAYDVYSSNISKTFNDISILDDANDILTQKPISDEFSLQDTDEFELTKLNNEILTLTERVSITFPNKPAIVDVININDELSLSLSTLINNTDAVVNLSEVGFLLSANADTYFFSESYVIEDYAGATVINIT